MTLTKSITSMFNVVSKPSFKKPRANIANYGLTLDFTKAKWVLIGVSDDRGIENNYGRVGAKTGPKAFREMFFAHSIASVAPAQHSIYDLGDLKLANNLKDSLDRLKDAIKEIRAIDPKKKILVIGGGHDIAFGEVAGCLPVGSNRKKHHIINIDAHADIRPLEKGNVITSGTPFYRLIEEEGFLPENYHPFGLQRTSNSKSLVDWMKKKKIEPYWLEEMDTTEKQIKKFSDALGKMKGKPWHFSIDLDGFPLSSAEGVSAPGVFGVSPNVFLQMSKIKSLDTLQSLGIYELNPEHDNHGNTARLAAKLAYLILSYST